MTVLASDITQRALEHLSIKQAGQALDADDADVCLRALSSLLDALQLDPQATIGLQEFTYTPTVGQQTVTIGPAGNIVATMPVALEPSCYYRSTSTGIDTPMAWASSFDEYAAQANKSMTARPRVTYYMRSNTGTGTLYLWPASDGSYQLHLWARQDVLSGYASLAQNTAMTLPNGYRNYLEYAVAEAAAPSFGLAGSPEHQAAMRAAGIALKRLKRAAFVSHQLQNAVGVTRRWASNLFTV